MGSRTRDRDRRSKQLHLESTLVAHCTLDERGVVLETNAAAAEMLDRTRDELVGRECASLLPPASRDVFARYLARCSETTAGVVAEIEIAGRTVRLIGQRFDRAGHLAGFRIALVDISDLEQRRSALHLLAEASYELGSTRDLASCLEHAARYLVPDIVDLCIIDVIGEAGVAERRVSLHGDPDKAELARRMQLFAPRRGWSSVQTRAMKSGQPILLAPIDDHVRREIALDRNHVDTLRALAISSELVVPLMAGKRAIGALTLAADARRAPFSQHTVELAVALGSRLALAIENSQLHTAASRAISARDEALAVISHDLNNAIGTTMMAVESLARQRVGADDERDARRIDLIRRSANMMRRLIHDLVDVSSIEGGRLAIARRRNDLASIIGEVVAGFGTQAAAESITITHELPEEPLVLDCDRDRVEQVFANLISNAIKFTPAGGAVVVRAKLLPRRIEVSVEDTGRGIAAADLPHVFDRFWQAPDSAHRGTGLGLTIAKGIVEAHGGRIRVESTPNIGSRFRFFLLRGIPLSTAARAQRGAAACARSREIAAPDER